MKKFMHLTIILLPVLLTTCKKDGICLIENYPFIIGNINCHMTSEVFPDTLDFDSHELDIDKDGSPDFLLESYRSASSGGVNITESSISVLNSAIEIPFYSEIDTFHTCTEYITQEPNDSLQHDIVYNGRSYICDFSIHSISAIHTYYYPYAYEYGDTIGFTEAWTRDKLTFYYTDYSEGGTDAWYVQYKIRRGSWRDGQYHYMVFRIKDGSAYRYGWLKLSCNRLCEYAFQNGN